MPKRPNAKKMASQAWSKVKTLDAAVSSGKYTVGHVTKSLGFCQFLCDVQTSKKIIEVTALIRGKMKGGKTCPTRVEIGHYLLLDGDMSKTMEVVGVVNRQSELDTLKGSGRVSKGLAAKKDEDDDDLFDRSDEKDTVEDIWAKRDEEREAEAAHLLGRYRRAEAGVRYRASRVVLGDAAVPLEAVADAVAEDDAEIVEVAADADAEGPMTSFRPITSKRRLAAMAAKAAAEVSVAEAIEKEELAGIWANMVPDWVEDANVAPVPAPKSRANLASWEDELDIDSI